eukprot:scaffold9441_cov167-Amphora_coffeaeformis.AAC.6
MRVGKVFGHHLLYGMLAYYGMVARVQYPPGGSQFIAIILPYSLWHKDTFVLTSGQRGCTSETVFKSQPFLL